MNWPENKIRRICRFCGEWATQKHHKFKNSKGKNGNRKVYGKLLDASFNIEDACANCNSSHANIPQWAIWSEEQFRAEATKRGYKLPAGTKSFQNKARF